MPNYKIHFMALVNAAYADAIITSNEGLTRVVQNGHCSFAVPTANIHFIEELPPSAPVESPAAPGEAPTA